MECYLHYAEQQDSPSNITNLRALRKFILMIGPRHGWNVIYIAGSNRATFQRS